MTTIAFVGAGSVVFTRDLLADILRFAELREVQIRLHDIDPERLATAEATAAHVARRVGAGPKVSAHADRRAALDGADFVVNMVQVGGHAATVTDFEVPARFGLRQTIADTIGIGGIFRHLRTSVLLDALAADMLDVCPQAWLLNYTNPMAMNVQYLAQRAPALKVVGLCHSVYWTVVGLCELISVPYEQVSYASAGVNHQAWLLRWERDGENLYPRLDARIQADPQLRRRTRVDLYRRLGYYPTETSEHSSEYLPWYLHHDQEVDRLRLPVGDYVRISRENLAEYAATREILRSGGDLRLEVTTEYAPQVVHSIVTGTPRTIVGTVANTGLITNLPTGAGVEVPCVVDAVGVRPVYVGDLPPQCAALNRSFLGPVELAVRAALDGDPRMIRRAAMVDPNTAATLPVEQIWQLCDELVAAHGDLMPEPLRAPCPL
ncbi:MAG TPA: alpha-glucosidase/alpha-galactosidase [Kineosporiaceae bacterium]|nr:alpha-glucosidase/alpha-galactosidase [Kineosporiaceae bacterium]